MLLGSSGGVGWGCIQADAISFSVSSVLSPLCQCMNWAEKQNLHALTYCVARNTFGIDSGRLLGQPLFFFFCMKERETETHNNNRQAS